MRRYLGTVGHTPAIVASMMWFVGKPVQSAQSCLQNPSDRVTRIELRKLLLDEPPWIIRMLDLPTPAVSG
jgi:hypothetical protein